MYKRQVQPEVTYRKYEKGLMRADGQPGFNTRTGRIELYCLGYAAHGDDPVSYTHLDVYKRQAARRSRQ